MTSALVLDNTGSKVSSWLRWKCFVLPVTPAHCTLPGGWWLLTIIVTIFVTQLHTCARQNWIYLCQNILFETSRIQETYYFWFCFSKNIRKTQIGEVNINRLILSQQVVKMFWIPASRGRRWWGEDRPAVNCGHCYAPRCWCWCVGVLWHTEMWWIMPHIVNMFVRSC